MFCYPLPPHPEQFPHLKWPVHHWSPSPHARTPRPDLTALPAGHWVAEQSRTQSAGWQRSLQTDERRAPSAGSARCVAVGQGKPNCESRNSIILQMVEDVSSEKQVTVEYGRFDYTVHQSLDKSYSSSEPDYINFSHKNQVSSYGTDISRHYNSILTPLSVQSQLMTRFRSLKRLKASLRRPRA